MYDYDAWAWLARRYGWDPFTLDIETRLALEYAAADIQMLRDELRAVATGHREHGTRSTRPEEGMELVRKFDLIPRTGDK